MEAEPDRGKAKRELERLLFSDAFLTAYAVIDGARRLDLLTRLDEFAPPHQCLYIGELEPEVAVVAPWLVELRENEDFFDWLFDEGWGDSLCIWLTSEAPILDVRAHFRRLTIVEMPDGQMVYFRFYDPRVLRAFLPTCDEAQKAQMFGEAVERFFVEDETGAAPLVFQP